MSRNTRNYPKNQAEELNGTVKKLKSQINNLHKEIKLLKSENRTLLEAWTKTSDFLYEITNGLSVEDMIDNDIETIKQKISVDYNKLEFDERESIRKKWAEWNNSRKRINEDI